MIPLVDTPGSRQDLAKAVYYYDAAKPNLGIEFLLESENALTRILDHPTGWAKLSEPVRRCQLHRFPYGVIYQIEEGKIVVLAVLHMHRHPDTWRSR